VLSLPLHSVLAVQHTASYYDLTIGSLCTLSASSLEPPFESSLPLGVSTSLQLTEAICLDEKRGFQSIVEALQPHMYVDMT
jgi:hypothetical protein